MSDSRIKQLVDSGYCVGCGSCAAVNPNIEIRETEFGAFQAKSEIKLDTTSDEVCPFLSSQNEDQLSKELFPSSNNYDPRIGSYIENYGGHVAENDYRKKASSGGMVSWVLVQLFEAGEIDGVIHVGANDFEDKDLFSYTLSESVEQIKKGAKSRYYPVHFDEVMKKVASSEKRYAFVGVPCFVKAARLLIRNHPEKYGNIKFLIAIFCGHLKSKGFSEMIAFQQGVRSEELAAIDFRVKSPERKASQYAAKVTQLKNGEVIEHQPVQVQKLYGLNWGLGYFKLKACDWCDDIAGETADLTCGDAWLEDYNNDGMGSNIVIVRNNLINEIIKKGIEENKLNLKTETVDRVYMTQEGNYRHRREGLSIRIEEAEKNGDWFPEKRIKSGQYEISKDRKKLYMDRVKLAQKSHENFLKAKTKNSWLSFVLRMLPHEVDYERNYGRAHRVLVKRTLYILKTLIKGKPQT